MEPEETEYNLQSKVENIRPSKNLLTCIKNMSTLYAWAILFNPPNLSLEPKQQYRIWLSLQTQKIQVIVSSQVRIQLVPAFCHLDNGWTWLRLYDFDSLVM